MEANKKWDLISISSIPLIMTLSNSMLIPVLPLLGKKLSITPFQASLIISVYAVVAIICIPVAGYLSDCYGRKKVIIPSLILAAAGGLVSGLSAWFITTGNAAYWLILAGRFIQGIGAAGAAPIVLPLVADLFKKEKDVSRGLGIIETFNTFGKVLSPILGAWLAALLWYLPFLAVPVLCLISLLMVGFFVKTPKREKEQPQKLSQFISDTKKVYKQECRWLTSVFVSGAIGMFVLFGTLFYLSETLEETLGIDGVYKGLLLAIPLSALCLASYLTGKFAGENKIVMKWITFSGLILVTGAMLICIFVQVSSMVPMFTFMTLSGIGIGVALPSLDALITEGIEKKHRGTISSIYSSMRFLGVAAGPPLLSILMKSSTIVVFGTLAAVSGVAALFALFGIKPKSTD